MESNSARTILTLALVAVAGALAYLGRLGLDWFISVAPRWASEIERFGGWALGMTIGMLVVIPVFRMYGVFNDGSGSVRRNKAELNAGDRADEMPKKR